jgi:hypothetical protein
MKQTAVEWFMEQIGEKQPNGLYVIDSLEDVKQVFEQAKEMERQQKQNCLTEYFEWHKSMGFVSHTPADIIEFNETYGGAK